MQVSNEYRTSFILEVNDRPTRFVQALCQHVHLLVESVSDDFLEGDDRLTESERDALYSRGWDEPVPAELGSPNWHREFEDSTGTLDAAGMLVDTLAQVHGVVSPAELTLRVGHTQDP